MPTPVSRMRIRTWFGMLGLLADVSAISQMCPPGGVNLIALFRRFTSTCVRRTASPSSVTVSSGNEIVNV